DDRQQYHHAGERQRVCRGNAVKLARHETRSHQASDHPDDTPERDGPHSLPEHQLENVAWLCAQRQTSVRPAKGKNTGHSAPRGKSNSGGRMPITVRWLPSMEMPFPTTAGSRPKRRCQSPWPINRTGGPPGASSSGVSVLPSSGATPRVSKNPAVTPAAPMRSGSPPSTRSAVRGANAAILAKLLL